MKFTASAAFDQIARAPSKELRLRVYARKTTSLAGSISGSAGWTEITDRIDFASFPDIQSRIEYEIGQFTSDSIKLRGHDVQWFKNNFLATNIRSPHTISGLTFWVDANKIPSLADGAAVAAWLDLSPTKAHATQATSGNRPVYKVNILNGKPIVRFTAASSHYLQLASGLSIDDNVTFFAVLKSTSNATAQTFFGQNSTTGAPHFSLNKGGITLPSIGTFIPGFNVAFASVDTLTSFCIFEYRRAGAGATHNLWKTAVAQSLGVNNTNDFTAAGTQFIGRRASASEHFDGDIAEIIIYNRALSTAERQAIEWYLSAKYNLGVSGTLSDDYAELKIEGLLTGASDVIPCFAGWMDKVKPGYDERSNVCEFSAFTVDELGNRITAENVSAQPYNASVDGGGTKGLVLPNLTGLYATNAAVSGYELSLGTHIINYDYNGGGANRRANLDGGAWVLIGGGGPFTLGNVDNSTGDTQRVTVYVNAGLLPGAAGSDKVIVLNFGEALPRRYYKDVQARYILSKLWQQLGVTDQKFDTLEFQTYDGAKRIFYLDTPPNNDGDVFGTKDALETDGTNLFVGKDLAVYRRDQLTGVYTLLTSVTQTIEKLMYNARNNHLWIYGGGSIWRYDIGGASLSSEVVLNATTTELSHYGIQLFDYNYTASSWKYGIVYGDKNSGTSSGLFRFLDASSMTVSTIVNGTTLTDTIYPYFTYVITGGKVRFRVFNAVANKHAFWEYQVSGAGAWTSNGEKLLGIDDYRAAAYHAAEARVYYEFDAGASTYLECRSHTDSSITPTTVYASNDGSAVKGSIYYAGDGNVYFTFDEAAGLKLFSAAANVSSLLYIGIFCQKNQMIYANARLFLLANSVGSGYNPSYFGISLYQWSNQCPCYVPFADFDGEMITAMIRKALNAFILIGTVSPTKSAFVYRRCDSSGTPLTTGNTLAATVAEAENITESAREQPKADVVVVTNGVTTHSYDGIGFDRTVLGDMRKVTIDNSFIPDAIVKDLAYYAYQFFKVDRNLKRFPLALVTLWQYEPFDNFAPSFTSGNIQETNSGPIYATTLSKDGSMAVEALI